MHRFRSVCLMSLDQNPRLENNSYLTSLKQHSIWHVSRPCKYASHSLQVAHSESANEAFAKVAGLNHWLVGSLQCQVAFFSFSSPIWSFVFPFLDKAHFQFFPPFERRRNGSSVIVYDLRTIYDLLRPSQNKLGSQQCIPLKCQVVIWLSGGPQRKALWWFLIVLACMAWGQPTRILRVLQISDRRLLPPTYTLFFKRNATFLKPFSW